MSALIAGKDRPGKIRWVEWLNLGLVAIPVYLGIRVAEGLEGGWRSLLSVCVGLLVGLVVLWWRGRSARSTPIQLCADDETIR